MSVYSVITISSGKNIKAKVSALSSGFPGSLWLKVNSSRQQIIKQTVRIVINISIKISKIYQGHMCRYLNPQIGAM